MRTTDHTFVKYSRAMSLAGDPSERSNLKGEHIAGTDDGFSARAIGR